MRPPVGRITTHPTTGPDGGIAIGAIELDHLRRWIGIVKADRDVLAVRHARLMAATVDLDPAAIRPGASLPPLWHWLYFLDGLPPRELGRDGHPARGGFLPPVPLANRMWAGGRVAFLAPLPLAATVDRRSQVAAVEHKAGRSGDLVFVTVLHEFFHEGTLALSEEHDIVYRNPSPPGTAPRPEPDLQAQHRKPFDADSTTLFRYSALTFNGHRIHYDVDYCRGVEGYANLVVHGPLSATLLAGYAQEITGRKLQHFSYRGVWPALLGAGLTLNASVQDGHVAAWTTLGDGSTSMQAEAVVG